ncbi:hypothetical protein D9M70_483340 [compost metagenome]
MEDQNDLGFGDGLKLEDEQRNLDDKGRDEKEIIAGKAHVLWPEQFCREDQGKNGAAEKAGEGLLDAEHQELRQAAKEAGRRQPIEQAVRRSVDARFPARETPIVRHSSHQYRLRFAVGDAMPGQCG